MEKVPERLQDYFKNINVAALAYSGGVDSSYLLYAAISCGVEVKVYYVKSQFQPEFELEDALRLTKELGVSMTVIELDALSDPRVEANPSNRCYYCKNNIFSNILDAARKDGCSILMDGSNASDDFQDRPGMKALLELKVLSPLREAGLTKEQIREHSKEAGLFTWNKPAYACLATRVPTGTRLDADMLHKIEEAENQLFQMGFSDFRARILGKAAKLQFPEAQFSEAAARHKELLAKLSPWFDEVVLDLKTR